MFKFKASKTVLVTSIVFSLAACQQVSNSAVTQTSKPAKVTVEMSDREAQIVAKLQWVKTADADADARAALASAGAGKVEIIGFSGRGKSFPGLSQAQYAEIEDRITYRLAKGTGDTIYGPTQKALRKDLRAYVSTYNTVIYDALTKAE